MGSVYMSSGTNFGAISLISSTSTEWSSDPELRSVLELATDEELCELQDILFGTRWPFLLHPLSV